MAMARPVDAGRGGQDESSARYEEKKPDHVDISATHTPASMEGAEGGSLSVPVAILTAS